MLNVECPDSTDSVLSTLLSEESFRPAQPRSIEDTGLSESLIESLICKYVAATGAGCGRDIAEELCLPLGVLEGTLAGLRARQILVHAGAAPLNDYYYTLTEQGVKFARSLSAGCAYYGPAPVTMSDYIVSVEAQSIGAEAPKRSDLEKAFRDISVVDSLFDCLGPAVNSSAGMFLYGAPGNGKSTIARRITMCFGQEIWIPYMLLEGDQLIKLFDSSYHHEVKTATNGMIKSTAHDTRWVKIRRPTVVVGGELTLDNLEIQHNARSNVSEAPLQLKSNCGCLLLDDFGRQRIAPRELLNRWIVPLECRYDFLTTSTGRKIQVPFEQLIIFSTNLEPRDLVDEAFLRRIPYKIEVTDPSEEEFHWLFELYCNSMGFKYRGDCVEYLLDQHYRPVNRALRRCHPRDLLIQIRNYCTYNDLPLEMRPDHMDRVVRSYFAMVLGNDDRKTPQPVGAYSPPAPWSGGV